MHPFSGVKGVYFDLDDTLCAYWDASKLALRTAFERHGPAGHEIDTMISHWAAAFRDFAPSLKQTGWYERYLVDATASRTEQMRLALLRVGIDEPERASRLSETYKAERNQNLTLFSDAIELLDFLAPRTKLGLITNGPADIQRLEIERLDLASRFDHIFIEGEMGYGKPDPRVLERAEAAMGLSPTQLLFVGNSYHHDIRPAIEKGWHSAWVRRPSDVPPSADGSARPEERPEDAPEPEVVVNDLKSLVPMF